MLPVTHLKLDLRDFNLPHNLGAEQMQNKDRYIFTDSLSNHMSKMKKEEPEIFIAYVI